MSETDDTDVLLLIPPNFFLVQSSGSEDSLLESSRTVVHKPLSCTAQVLGKLVNQVHSLESRLEGLELTGDVSGVGTVSRPNTWDTTDSFDSRSLDRKCYTFPRRRRRKVSKKQRSRSRDLSLTSLDSVSTRGRSIPSLKLEESVPLRSKPIDIINDIQSMDGDLSSIVSTPSKKNDKLLLHEIDEFLTKVESYESPETKYKNQHTSVSSENVIQATGDYISHKLDSRSDGDEIKLPSGRVVSSDILDKYIYLVRNSPSSSHMDKQLPLTTKASSVETNNDCPEPTPKSSMETSKDMRTPIRRLNFNEKEVQPTSTPKRPQTSYTDTFRPTSNKIYDRASKVLEQYKSQSYRTQGSIAENTLSPKKEEFKMPQMRPYCHDNKDKLTSMQSKFMDSIDTDLLSLSELWGERGDRVEGVKLEEERLKREHCEAIIQQLQKKVLDQQEKLAVALKVDRAKDTAIAKLRDAWLRLTGNLDKAEERHRGALDKMVREVENFRMVADDAQKKTSHFEAELYKTLDLAHDYQEKCKQLMADKKEAEDKMERMMENKQEAITSKDREIEVLKENYETIMRLNRQSTDCVKHVEDALEKEKSDHEQTKKKSVELGREIQSQNDEMCIVAQERDSLREKVHDERSRYNLTERQLCEVQNHNSQLLKKCDNLDDEVKSLRKHLELQKTELKCHYQKQLEDAVLGKLQEFQLQLDHAEREMETDARTKEMATVDTYNKQIVRIEEQHKLEVNLLEEKQREEMKLYRLQLAQASEKIGLLESKLESYRRRRGQLAAQLHGVMQAQWRQALRILTSSRRPDLSRPDTVSSIAGHEYAAAKIPPLTLPPGAERGLTRDERSLTRDERSLTRDERSLTRDERSLTRDERSLTRDERSLTRDEQRRVDDKLLSLEGLSDDELQHYVKLLLTKPANLDGSGDSLAGELPRELDEPTSDRPAPHDRRDRAKRGLNASKPPWKA